MGTADEPREEAAAHSTCPLQMPRQFLCAVWFASGLLLYAAQAAGVFFFGAVARDSCL